MTPLELLALTVVVLVLLALISGHLRSPSAKGARGERRVNSVLDRKLPPREYKAFHDVTLYSAWGSTQIDHIVVSRYGIFVIETKNYTGWIFGDARSKQWTQTIYHQKTRFQNPLRQNYKHTRAVELFLSLSPHCIHSVVVFVGDAEFKTNLPDNVTHLSGLSSFILSRSDYLLDTASVRAIAKKLDEYQAGREFRKVPTLTIDPD